MNWMMNSVVYRFVFSLHFRCVLWQQKLDLESFLANCPWMVSNSTDWIYMSPAIIVLFVNILFLVKIMWVSLVAFSLLF